jgi:hypothetical protein
MSSNKTREITPVERFDVLLGFLNDLYQERDEGIYPKLENRINNMENIVRKNKEKINKLISDGEINNERYIEILKNIRNIRRDKGKTRANGRASKRARGGMKRTYGNRTPQKTGLTPQQKKTKTIKKRTRNHKKRYPKTGNRTRKLVIAKGMKPLEEAKGMKPLEEDMAMMNFDDNPSPSKYYIPRPKINNSMVKTLNFSGGKKRKRRIKTKRKRKRRRTRR